ncbi:hypothetical protein MBLNU457_3712t2 [Dothideomycetes sp. NU457]
MGGDPLSPVAPARVRVLLLPVGRIKRSRFESFVERLQGEPAVRLGDITPDARPDRNLFSPLAFPEGTLLLNLSTSLPPASQAAFAPYELFRLPFAILGIVDGQEYKDNGGVNGQETDGENSEPGSLENALKAMREQFPRALMFQLLAMDCSESSKPQKIPQDAICVPSLEQSTSTTIKTAMCDVSSQLLGEMAMYGEIVKSWSTAPTPLMSQSTVPGLIHDQRNGLQRTTSLRSQRSRDESPNLGLARQSSIRNSPRDVSSPPSSVMGSPRPESPAIMSGSFTPDDNTRSGIAEGGWKQSTKQIPAEIDRSKSLYPQSSTQTSAERERNIGRWADAWRELLEQTSRARALNDWLWHAKGLENLLACMLLLGWSGFDFHIPTMIHAGVDGPGPKSFADATKDLTTTIGHQDPIAASSALRKLGTLLPEIVATIIGQHDKAATTTGEAVPQLILFELILRMSQFLAVLSEHHTDVGLHIMGDALPGGSLDALRRAPGAATPTGLSKINITEVLFRAYPGPFIGMSLIERTTVLAGIASTLSLLKLDRKRAIIVKDLLANLIPALLQARKLGAAEMGIHPAASLSLANGPADAQGSTGGPLSVNQLLEQLQSTYSVDILSVRAATTVQDAQPEESFDRLISLAADAATQNASYDVNGNLNLKLDILRACIEFCEALPDLPAIVHCTALLLRSAGPHASLSTAPRKVVSMSTDEQVRLLSNMSRAANAAARAGLTDIQANYWDDFLLRDIQLYERASTGRLIEHSKDDLQQQLTKKGPFLYDAFAKKADSEANEKVIIANETVELILTVQNPYDFEIIIERITLATEGGSLDVQRASVTLGPRRLQNVHCLARAQATGQITVRGCLIKVAGCRERFFPIYHELWTVEAPLRMKNIGRGDLNRVPKISPTKPKRPSTSSVAFTVIQAQPQVIIQGTDLHEGVVMLLEGEKHSFRVTLLNASESITTDFVHISFEDSVTGSLRSSLSANELSRAEMYELETQLAQNPILEWKRVDSDPDSNGIAPGQSAVYEFSVVGRPGLSNAKILFDFACLGSDQGEKTRFFTRQVALSINITVNASVQISRPDIISMPPDFKGPARENENPESSHEPSDEPHAQHMVMSRGRTRFAGILSKATITAHNDHCLLLLDVRNAWPNPLIVSLHVGRGDLVDFTSDQYEVQETVHPGHVARLMLVLPRIYVSDPHAPIPALSKEGQRQFVVSSTAISPEQERASREAFWYREELLKLVSGSWTEESSERSGVINLRTIRLSAAMIETLRLEDLDISFDVTSSPGDDVQRHGRARFEVSTQSFLTLRTKIQNRSDRPLQGILRLLPLLANQPQDMALDTGRRFVWTGLLQKGLPVIQSGETFEEELGFCVLNSGDYQVSAVVEELQVKPRQDTKKTEDDKLHMKDHLARERRTWRATEPCSIRAVDIE